MATAERQHRAATHEVFNQPPPLEDYNPFDADRPLSEALRREGADWAEDRIARAGRDRRLARRRSSWGVEANENKPSCAPTTATATASTRSSSTPPGTS